MASTPNAPPTSGRTPNPTSSGLPTTSMPTPHAPSQDTDQLLRSSFAPITTDSRPLAFPQPTPFPPASTFSFIPDLYSLISRLSLLEGTPQFQGPDGSRAATASPLLSRDAVKAEMESSQTDRSQTRVVQLKDLPENVYELKQGIQNARDVVSGLPDIERGIGEQEAEIEALKREILGLRKRMAELAVLARDDGGLKMKDVVMQGVEDG